MEIYVKWDNIFLDSDNCLLKLLQQFKFLMQNHWKLLNLWQKKIIIQSRLNIKKFFFVLLHIDSEETRYYFERDSFSFFCLMTSLDSASDPLGQSFFYEYCWHWHSRYSTYKTLCVWKISSYFLVYLWIGNTISSVLHLICSQCICWYHIWYHFLFIFFIFVWYC